MEAGHPACPVCRPLHLCTTCCPDHHLHRVPSGEPAAVSPTPRVVPRPPARPTAPRAGCRHCTDAARHRAGRTRPGRREAGTEAETGHWVSRLDREVPARTPLSAVVSASCGKWTVVRFRVIVRIYSVLDTPSAMARYSIALSRSKIWCSVIVISRT